MLDLGYAKDAPFVPQILEIVAEHWDLGRLSECVFIQLGAGQSKLFSRWTKKTNKQKKTT
jgi:hypothetical protein